MDDVMCIGEKKYSRLIPKEYRSKTVQNLFITTYTLELEALKTFLIPLIDAERNKEKIHIYYDSLRLKHDCNNFLPKECYHEIKRTKEKHNFHPKIALLDYGNDGFVIIVSSKNISSSKYIEAYAVAHDDGDIHDKLMNGKAVADFFGSFTELDESVKERLKKNNFVIDNAENISFLTGKDVYDIIEKVKSQLTIVSPFVTEDFVKNPNLNVEIYSNSPLGIKSYVNQLDENFHSKIYCWNDSQRTHWIIGSSNATANGLSKKDNGNYEFNICFETKLEDYDDFHSGLDSCFGESNGSKNESQREKAEKTADEILDDLMLTKKIISAKGGCVKVEFNFNFNKFRDKLNDLKFAQLFLKTGNSESTRIDLNSNTSFQLELESKELFEYFDVVLSFEIYENDKGKNKNRTHFPLEWEDKPDYINQKAMAELKKWKSELDKRISFETLIDKSVSGDQELIKYMEQLCDEQKDKNLRKLLECLKKKGGSKNGQ